MFVLLRDCPRHLVHGDKAKRENRDPLVATDASWKVTITIVALYVHRTLCVLREKEAAHLVPLTEIEDYSLTPTGLILAFGTELATVRRLTIDGTSRSELLLPKLHTTYLGVPGGDANRSLVRNLADSTYASSAWVFSIQSRVSTRFRNLHTASQYPLRSKHSIIRVPNLALPLLP